jgi:hypothetical protein
VAGFPELREHLVSAAAEAGVRIHWISDWRRAESFPGIMVAYVPRIRRPADYLVGLHEIGHCASDDALRLTDSADPYEALLCEGASWAWAVSRIPRDLALTIRAAEWDVAAYCLRTHWQTAARTER